MQYLRCKCGKLEAWTSGEKLAECLGCKECGTTLNTGSNQHKAPMPHEFIDTSVETDNGPAVLSRCKYCYRIKKQIEKAGD